MRYRIIAAALAAGMALGTVPAAAASSDDIREEMDECSARLEGVKAERESLGQENENLWDRRNEISGRLDEISAEMQELSDGLADSVKGFAWETMLGPLSALFPALSGSTPAAETLAGIDALTNEAQDLEAELGEIDASLKENMSEEISARCEQSGIVEELNAKEAEYEEAKAAEEEAARIAAEEEAARIAAEEEAARQAAEEEAARQAEEEAARKAAEEAAAEAAAQEASSSGGLQPSQYPSTYTYGTSGGQLTRDKGVVYYNGHKETWYTERILPGESLNIPGRHTDSQGLVRDGDGYICVASSDLSKGTIIETSLGMGKVYDSGCAKGTIDIYTNW